MFRWYVCGVLRAEVRSQGPRDVMDTVCSFAEQAPTTQHERGARQKEREREREEGEFCPRRNSGSGMQERLSWNHVDSASWQAGVTALFPWTRRVATSEISTMPPHSRSVPNDSKRDHCTVLYSAVSYLSQLHGEPVRSASHEERTPWRQASHWVLRPSRQICKATERKHAAN